MAGDINAIGILIVPIATAFLVVKFGRLPKRPLVILTSVAVPFFIAMQADILVVGLRALDLREKSPCSQWLVPCICLGLVLMFVRPMLIRLWVAVGMAATAFLLSHHYLNLVDTKDYTGSPFRVLLRNDALKRLSVRIVDEVLSDLPHPDSTSYPEGWLSESEIATLYLREHPEGLGIYEEQYLVDFAVRSYDAIRLWHTRITGLYRTKPKTLEIWYPGGPIRDALDRLEFRERPSSPNSPGRSKRTPRELPRALKGHLIIAQGKALGRQIVAPNPALKGRFNHALSHNSIDKWQDIWYIYVRNARRRGCWTTGTQPPKNGGIPVCPLVEKILENTGISRRFWG